MDIFLLIVLVVALALITVAGIYLLVHFSHPDDKNDAYFPKFVVLMGFILAEGSILLLPLDVANAGGYAGCEWEENNDVCGGLNMELLWSIFFWAVFLFLVLVIPMTTFFYESDDFDLSSMTGGAALKKTSFWSKLCSSFCYELMVIVIIGGAFLIAYGTLNVAEVDVEVYSAPFSKSTDTMYYNYANGVNGFTNVTTTQQMNAAAVLTSTSTVDIKLSYNEFFPALLLWIGYFFFAIFGGIGIISLPLTGIMAYFNKPKVMDPVELANLQDEVRSKVNELVSQGEQIQSEKSSVNPSAGFLEKKKQNRAVTKKVNKLRKDTFALESDFAKLSEAKIIMRDAGYGVAYALKLILGCLGLIISILWVAQVILFVLPANPVHSILNEWLKILDFFPLFPVLMVMILGTYLVLAVINGEFKVGLRLPFFTIHPMVYGGTYMSSFLFNIGLVLLCSIPIVQFTVMALREYANNTVILISFGAHFYTIKFLNIFWEKNIFQIAFLAFAAITTFYYIVSCWCIRRKNRAL